MESRNRRRAAIAAAVVALVAALALVLLLAGGDDDEAGDRAARDTTAIAPPPEREEPGERTAPSRKETRREGADLARTVTVFVQAREETDARTLCQLLGQPASGTGPAAVDTCARAAGVDLSALPTSDELSVETTLVSGRLASVRLAGGTTVRLRKAGGRWRVTEIRRHR